MEKVAVFVPVRNEAQALGNVLAQIPQAIQDHPVDLVVVDDHSTDGSAHVARRFTSHVISLEEHNGVGMATKKGLIYISALADIRYVIKFDGDGQHNPQLLPLVLQRLASGYDVVICSRFHPQSDQKSTPWDRTLLNTMFTEAMRRLTGTNFTDVRSGYMGFHFSDIQAIAPQLIRRGYGIPMELLLRLWHLKRPNFQVADIPHPALYGGDLCERLRTKYASETVSEKAHRWEEAAEAFISVLLSLDIAGESITSGIRTPGTSHDTVVPAAEVRVANGEIPVHGMHTPHPRGNGAFRRKQLYP